MYNQIIKNYPYTQYLRIILHKGKSFANVVLQSEIFWRPIFSTTTLKICRTVTEKFSWKLSSLEIRESCPKTQG